MPRNDLTISDRLAAFGITHAKVEAQMGEGRRYLRCGDKPMGLLDSLEAVNLLELLEGLSK